MEKQRTIIVTGASSGIGAYCAGALRAEGWRVFATARKPEDIAALASKGLEAFYLDYREPESIAKLFDDVMQRTDGNLDALFNNGAYSQAGAVEDLPVASPQGTVRGKFLRLARPDATGHSGDAQTGSRAHRPLLVDSRARAVKISRRIRGLQACA